MRSRMITILLVSGALLGGAALAGNAPASGSPATLAPLKALAGSWQAKGPDGKAVRATYEVQSGGSAVVEKLEMGGPAMITVYYADGKDLMLTHYCSMGNQPRMRTAGAPTGKEVDFAFVDATNLETPAADHMHGLKFTFTDANHFSQVWTMHRDGQEMPVTFSFERAK
ncbi:MAG TPA: hypothetical protein VHR45_13080 [Thermoanaerobaculia bacterium]|nr:hypothetical protein [Thermoanaerobaculia bacterium]